MQDIKTLSLPLKYRPQKFDEMIGNETVISSLKSILQRTEGRPHALLFTGKSGCGKTTLARIVSSEIGCDLTEIREYNVANVRGIDTIRDIINTCRYKPKRGSSIVYIMDEFHQATKDAQNGMLKLLEDTPKHVYFIICSTNPESILPTIRTRCSTYNVLQLTTPEIVKLLKRVAEAEKVEFKDTVYREIAKRSNGSPRQALVILDQIIDIEGDDETIIKAIQESNVSETELSDLCRLLLDARPKKWPEIATLLKNFRGEAEQARYGILGWLSTVLLSSGNPKAAELLTIFSDSYMYIGKPGLIRDCYYASKIFEG